MAHNCELDMVDAWDALHLALSLFYTQTFELWLFDINNVCIIVQCAHMYIDRLSARKNAECSRHQASHLQDIWIMGSFKTSYFPYRIYCWALFVYVTWKLRCNLASKTEKSHTNNNKSFAIQPVNMHFGPMYYRRMPQYLTYVRACAVCTVHIECVSQYKIQSEAQSMCMSIWGTSVTSERTRRGQRSCNTQSKQHQQQQKQWLCRENAF